MSDLEDMDDVVREFLVESHENLDQLDRDLVALEKDPRSHERLASVFRTIHTIKGTCGFLGFGKLESVAHVGESLLSRLRDGELTLTAEITTGLLSMVDAVRQMLSAVEAAGNDGDGDYSVLVATLTALQQQSASPPVVVVEEPGSVASAPSSDVDAVWAEALSQAAAAATPEPVAAAPAEAGHAVSDATIRVDVGLLDKLMNLVGELVLARNQVLQFTVTQADTAFVATSQRLNLITTELQEGVMKTRMQPIGNIWGKFPRVVRDLAVACAKQVRVEMEGRETELDKTIIEAIKDPLTHVVRNAVDHGIESPAVRTAAGKPTEGRLFLRAFHEGGQVNIEISDDGGGLDHERIREKAVQRGLITAEQAARMTDREIVNLIFLPGFSTAPKVTNVSGRGVGMDVVKTNIEKIGGTVDVQSRPGQGTTLRIKIPLTLAIIPALIVTSAGDRYAIPQVSLLELVRLEAEQAARGIEMIHGAPVYRLRGNLLPLVYLNRELGVDDGVAPAADAAVNIVVLQADDRQFGLVVESINDTEEIVVKPLGKQLKSITSFAGATIMGDGKVALILDVLGIAQRANVVSELRDRALGDHLRQADHADDRQTLLLLGVGAEGRMAIPLSVVARLEEFPRATVEHAGSHEVVQYRDQIMRLVRLGTVLGTEPLPTAPDAPLQVVVYAAHGRSVGLVVDRILDIVEEALTVQQRETTRAGLLGSAVIQGRVTDLIDVRGIIEHADPHFFDAAAAAA
ncbi:MAG TPA: chemotaxis protein CheW [Candidatus Binatia bacterium]|jgi:two-component system chemotaxis sensor kinase CheA|nr:chemotaxis protein CheW [Candidatus Binatia bacterium]